jgi:hypothetical protein
MTTEKLPVPPHWTGEQAFEVVEFLDQMIRAIWTVHGKKMEHVWNFPPEPPESDTSEFPF